ncbi:hypothetical protein [Falsibacillus albus]|uniref:Uncharacterized protein n=1 Tax=Falsibacillus albus TaxID=2478915 RepID=A0A3L7JUN8_9BACI|nr:hypothetical protein [Falsibacillus albus]RLQ93361.1 hypothetical protein D9X91_18030 [Falsibacillus albus]
MEKTYIIASMIFGWVITMALGAFTFAAFYLHYIAISAGFIIIFLLSIFLNVNVLNKWRCR